MTDISLRMNAIGGHGRNDVTTLQNVVVGCRIAEEEWDNREAQASANLPAMFPFANNDDQRCIQPKEIVFTVRGNKARVRKGQLIPCFSAFNGAGKQGMEVWELAAIYEAVGFAITMATHDSRGENTSPDFTTRVGGTYTVPVGPFEVHLGDIMVWDIDPQVLMASDRRNPNKNKALAYIRPIEDGKDYMTEAALAKFLYEKAGDYTFRETEPYATYPVQDAACILGRAIVGLALTSLLCLHNEGFVTIHPETLDPSSGKAARQQKKTENKNKMANRNWVQMLSLLGWPGLRSKDRHQQHVVSRQISIGESPYQEEFCQYMMRSIIGDKIGDFAVRRNARGHVPSGDEGEVHNAQANCLSNLLAAAYRAENGWKERAMGTALCAAPPNGEIDIIMGSYLGRV